MNKTLKHILYYLCWVILFVPFVTFSIFGVIAYAMLSFFTFMLDWAYEFTETNP